MSKLLNGRLVLLGLLSFSLAAGAAFAQERGGDAAPSRGRRCAAKVPNEAERTKARGDIGKFKGANAAFCAGKDEITIPIQFHIIHNGAAGKVPIGQIDDQVKVLNDAYKAHGYQFTKAAVKFHDKPEWFLMTHKGSVERQAKKALQADPLKNLNFYTANLAGNLLGWATFPDDLAGDPEIDGVVVLHSSLPGGSEVPFNLGDTATHEVGHWLGLYHTFQGGCTPPGDEVDDTPAEGSDANGTCEDNQSRDTCPAPGMDPITNFMDYTVDACMNQFTSGQAARVRQMVGTYRGDLLAPALTAKTSYTKVKTD